MRTDKGDLHGRIELLHHLCNLHVDVKTGRRSEEHKQIVLRRHGHCLINSDLMRRSIDDRAIRDHTGRIAEPHRVPVGFNLAGSRPPGTGPTVKALKRRRVKE